MRVTLRPNPKIDIPIVNIGDIAFLLIIFFILTSTFMRESYIKVTPPTSPDIDKLGLTPVSVTVDQSGTVWLQGVACQVEALESGVSVLLEGKPDKAVLLKIDKGLPQKTYGPVLLALSKAGAEVALIGTEQR